MRAEAYKYLDMVHGCDPGYGIMKDELMINGMRLFGDANACVMGLYK